MDEEGGPVSRCHEDLDTEGEALQKRPKIRDTVRMRRGPADSRPAYLFVKLRPWGRVLNQRVSHGD